MSFNIALLLKQTAERKPHKAVICPSHITGGLNYLELWGLARQVAHALTSLGVERGDRVMLVLPNISEFAKSKTIAKKKWLPINIRAL